MCQMCHLQTDCGECAHIVAAGKDGPRNKHKLVQEHVISEDYEINTDENGLYLCANCHTKIDHYPDKYTYEYLIGLRSNSDKSIINGVGKLHPSSGNENDNSSKDENGGRVDEKIIPRTKLVTLSSDESDNNQELSKFIFKLKHHNSNTESCVQMNYYQCSKCYKQLSSQQNLVYHTSHNVCVSKYVCPHCHVSFSSKRILDNHIQKEVCLKRPKLAPKNQQAEQLKG